MIELVIVELQINMQEMTFRNQTIKVNCLFFINNNMNWQ